MALAPRHRPVAPPPADWRAERVTLRQEGAPDLVGWLIPETAPLCGAAVLLHGRGSARDRMLARAALLRAAGFAVAAFDFQGHGESGGPIRGFGRRETEDVRRVAAAIRAFRPGARLAVAGLSLGAAAATLSAPQVQADAYVLEGLYATLIETTAERMPIPALRALQARLLHLQTPLRLGYGADALRPIDDIARIEAPILLLAGGRDPWATPDQTRRLARAAGDRAATVWFPEAGHADFLRADPERYRQSVVPFLRRALCPDL